MKKHYFGIALLLIVYSSKIIKEIFYILKKLR